MWDFYRLLQVRCRRTNLIFIWAVHSSHTLLCVSGFLTVLARTSRRPASPSTHYTTFTCARSRCSRSPSLSVSSCKILRSGGTMLWFQLITLLFWPPDNSCGKSKIATYENWRDTKVSFVFLQWANWWSSTVKVGQAVLQRQPVMTLEPRWRGLMVTSPPSRSQFKDTDRFNKIM